MTDMWRSPEERDAGVPAPGEVHPRAYGSAAGAAVTDDGILEPVKRRSFLQVLGGVLAMGAGCTKQPEERIIPYVKKPEDVVSGVPLFYASATVLGGVATGVLVEQNEGRPTKLEGNPEHPASLGATDNFTQAATFDLYDPDRSRTLKHLGAIGSWSALVGVLQKTALKHKSKRGEGLRLLTGAVGSPTLIAQIEALLHDMPLAKWHWYEPVFRAGARQGSALAFERDLEARYDLTGADVIVSLDADLFGTGPGKLAYARQFAGRRREGHGAHAPSRLYVFEPTPSITGSRADHRFPVRAADIEPIARALASLVGVGIAPAAPPASLPLEKLNAIVADLKKAKGRSVVVPGDFQPPAVHALAHAINEALGNVGATVWVGKPALFGPADPVASLAALCQDMDAGKVETLLILGTNPVYGAPADLAFEAKLKKVPLRVHLGLHDDETAGLCHWHVPEAHSLEAWTDGRAYDGTVTIIQPLIAPLYGGKTAHEMLIALSDHPERTAHDAVQEHFARQSPETTFARALHDGIAASAPPRLFAPQVRSLRDLPPPAAGEGLEIVFRPDAAMFDGRFSSNAWLQEIPRPLTKITWDNAAFVSPEDARSLGLSTGDVVELALGGRTVRAPVWILPGQAKDSVAVNLGYGRARGGKIGVGVGFDAQRIRASTAPWHAAGLALKKTGETHEFATTQGHHSMEGRDIVRSRRFGEHGGHGAHGGHGGGEKHHLSLYPDKPYPGYAWGMAIDLTACIGCNACMTACHAENNVPVVGKVEVARGREMSWIRIDRYYEGPEENPRTHFQPLPCQQCENAPCEVVCPVQATTHSDEGLNDMVYNRCVGTKYCSNNCPYKVRRYNFFPYATGDVSGVDMTSPSLALLHNPDVTVRSYGVMEKCTYCVQRIVGARIETKKAGRRIHDGEVMTACQSACPTQAITFGDINDKSSQVAQRRAEDRHYSLLDDLNTKPRTTYLASLWNPNPALGEKG
jgi:molybdopterin-containing oxidoreductase family iron-sulfur binding subunit